jgi:hypothetical protein
MNVAIDTRESGTRKYKPTSPRAAYSPDATFCLRYTQDGKRKWEQLLEYSANSGLLEPFGLSLSADGKKFAVGGMEGALELYDSITGKKLKKSENSGNTIWGVVTDPAGMKVMALELDDGYRMDTVAIGYWNTADAELKKVAVDPETVIGLGRDTSKLLVVRQETAGQIRVDSVE